MKTTIKLFLLVLISITLQNCDKDDFDSPNNNDPDLNTNDQVFQSEHFGNATTGNFMGLITDENGEKLENVQISIGNSITNTDRNGLFILNNVNVFENFAYIKASKNGYINGSRVVIPKTDGVNRINIVLLEKVVTATVNSGEPSTVFNSGATVNFPGNFITSEGEIYNGQVEVVLHYLQPNNNSTFTQMPGSLFAQTSTNDAVALETYGMLSVNLFSPSGEALNIDENNPATIEYPIHYTQTDIAPETINLWYFDDTVGYWKEEGQAIKSENKYIAEVTHFTWWNYDLPIEYVNLCFSITSSTSEASTPYAVSITRNINNQLIYNGTVSSQDGLECGLIPVNEEITVTVYSAGGQCFSQLVHEEVLNGFSSDSNVNISFSENIQTTTISGTVTNCNGNPLTNGYVYVDENNTFSVTDGTINIGIQHCATYTTQIQIFDTETLQWTVLENIELNGSSLNIGVTSTCENSGGVFSGIVELFTQADVDTFGLFGYTEINGSIIIGDSSGFIISDITDLSSLSTINSVESQIIISNNGNLTNIQGLQNINNLNSLAIQNNELLTNLDEMPNLITMEGEILISNNDSLSTISSNLFSNLISFDALYISNNENLNSIEFSALTNIRTIQIIGNESLDTVKFNNLISIIDVFAFYTNGSLMNLGEYNNLNSIGRLEIGNNESLLNLDSLVDITELNGLQLVSNNSLISIEGLINITSTEGRIAISENSSLLSLNGLNNLSETASLSISDLPLISLEGLENLISLNGNNMLPRLRIENNLDLVDFCDLQNLFINGVWDSEYVTILNNAYNPTPQNIIDGNCIQ